VFSDFLARRPIPVFWKLKKIELIREIQKINIITNSDSNRTKKIPVDRYLESASIHVIKLVKDEFCDLF
jgi:hypothetical protein